MAWNEILGHDVAKRLLQSHLAAGTVPNGYLLAGPDGVGKRRLALEMAKALNCEAPQRPCDACPSCRRIDRGTCVDVHLVAPTSVSGQIRIEEIRQLLGRLALRPFGASVQVAIIDGVERLTEEAANSLLKMLEEPPPHSRFVLLTAHLAQCVPTIVSRCQLIRCHGLPAELVKHILVETQGCDARLAEAASRLSGGSVSQAAAFVQRWPQYQAVLARCQRRGPSAWLEQPMPDTRDDVAHLLDGLMSWLRDVAVASAADPARVAHPEHREAIREQAQGVDLDRCLETALSLVELRESVDQFVSPRLIASVARERWLSLFLS